MISIIGRRNSANVQKVMWTVGELGIEYTRQDMGGSFGYSDEYSQLNPNQVVPTIRDGDLSLWESNACVRYEFTMADIPLGTITYRYLNLDIERIELPHVSRWYQRICERPAFQYHVMIPFGANAEEWLQEEINNAKIQ